MKVRVYRSEKGDCLLINGSNAGTILVDGGTPESYENHWLRSLNQVNGDNPIDVVMVSHIDRDHIGGILEMMHNKVAWEIYKYQSGLPSHLRSTNVNEPELIEPPAIKAIWHNAFFEQVRTDVFASSSGVDMVNVLLNSAAILAGDTQNSELCEKASRIQFLGQSVGDAIELSRRIGPAQLNIPHNPDFDGDFIVRKDDAPEPRIGDMKATILGPTENDLKKLLTEWNKWVQDKIDSGYIRRLLDDHDEDARHLPSSSLESVLNLAKRQALEFASNQSVTPPNLASLIVLLTEDNQTILLTGDADDPNILKGLEETGNMDENGKIQVDIFKVPHHGAHNSYSDTLARRVTADHYIFCGNGEHGNPEQEVVESYLVALFEGDSDNPPAAPSGRRIHFWFNCSADLADAEFVTKWTALEAVLEVWESDFPLFNAHFLDSGQSFVVG